MLVMTPRKKSIHVACAIIEQGGKVLAAQRSERMNMPLKWEFPGGKIDNDESPEECLKRECQEELGIEIEVGSALSVVTHSYSPIFTVTLYPYLCSIRSGEVTLREHKAVRWTKPGDMRLLDWADADWPILDEYLKRNGSA